MKLLTFIPVIFLLTSCEIVTPKGWKITVTEDAIMAGLERKFPSEFSKLSDGKQTSDVTP